MKKCINKRCNKILQNDFVYCPYCGKSQIPEKKAPKRPNGTGSIYKRKDNKSNPWAASSTFTGKRVYIGSFPTKTEAIKALQTYEYNPTTSYNITLEELHEEWKATAYRNIGKCSIQGYESSWIKLKPLYKRKFREIRTGELQAIIDYYDSPHQQLGKNGVLMYLDDKGNGTSKVTDKIKICDGLKYSALHKIKVLLTNMYSYAMQNDIVNKNYATFIILPERNESSKTRFTDAQLELIKQNINKIPYADYIYCMCYLNFRLSEFLELTKDDYYISETNVPLFIGGKKTEAGTDRLVPIHPNIQNIVSDCIAKNGETIFCDKEGKSMDNNKFRRNCFYPTLDALGLPRTLTPQSCRRTFSTRMSAAGARQEDIIALMGHTNFDVDINHYINQEADTLYNAVKKML